MEPAALPFHKGDMQPLDGGFMVARRAQRSVIVSLLCFGPALLDACISPPRHPSEAEKQRLDATCATQSYEDCLREKNIDEDTIAEMVSRRNSKLRSYSAPSKPTTSEPETAPSFVAEQADASVVDPLLDCATWFNPQRRMIRMSRDKVTIPDDINKEVARVNVSCATEAGNRGLLYGKQLADFTALCIEREGTAYCQKRLAQETAENEAARRRASLPEETRAKQNELMNKLVAWAKKNIPVTWQWNKRTFSKCTNVANVEVPCTSTGLIKKADFEEITIHVRATNNSRLALSNCFGKAQELTPIMVASNFDGVLGRGDLRPGKPLALQSPTFTGASRYNLVAVESAALLCTMKWTDAASAVGSSAEELDSLFSNRPAEEKDGLKLGFVHVRQLAGDASDGAFAHVDGVTYGDQ